jgi:large subunit ribosomal protein L28
LNRTHICHPNAAAASPPLPLAAVTTMHPRCQLLSGHLATALRAPATATAQRTFTTSASLYNKNPLQRRKGGDLGSHLPKHVISQDAHIPDYPYGDQALFKQANKGLYGERMVQYGNNVSHKTKTTTRRKWTPNVLSKSLYSVALKKRIKLRVTSNVMKTIDREGGLDEYLLKDSVQRIKELGPTGWALRWTLMQKPEVIDRLRAEAAALGIEQATIDKQWPTPIMLAQQKYADRVETREQAIAQAAAQAAEVEHVEQGMWAGEEGAEGEADDATAATVETGMSHREIVARKKAKAEYISALGAAKRYRKLGYVSSEEDGLKMAFIRQRERKTAKSALHDKFTEKTKDMFTTQDLEAIAKRINKPNTPIYHLRNLAYQEHIRAQIAAAGGREAFEAQRAADNAEKLAHIKATVDAAGGPEALQRARKEEFAAAIAEAESAGTNLGLDDGRRHYLERAIKKAGWVAKAKAGRGVKEYMEMVIADSDSNSNSNPGLRALFPNATRGEKTGGDAWAALVDSSNKPTTENRPNA